MKTIKVMRGGRPATAEELNCAVAGKPLPPLTGSTLGLRVTGSATKEQVVLGVCVLLRSGELTSLEIWKIQEALKDATPKADSGCPQPARSKCEIRAGVGLCDCCGEPKWPQEDMGYGAMLCLDCIDHSRSSNEKGQP